MRRAWFGIVAELKSDLLVNLIFERSSQDLSLPFTRLPEFSGVEDLRLDIPCSAGVATCHKMQGIHEVCHSRAENPEEIQPTWIPSIAIWTL